ncbi:scarecrow-like protein 9 [Panicum miliaceum]|uniref:Scarecrow-like protein 9 n=1 Tax=Panicum miliaceum TaxID=4540 RepID=A0A3L6TIE5_PANMI|nr:scarecrow-like protein 9 [Panicum miliaceum]
MGLDNTYGELSGMFCGGLSYDAYTDHSSTSDYFRFSDPLPAVVPQMVAEPHSIPSSTISRANTETDNPEDWEFISDESLNYISRMLLEEDIDEKVSMYQAESAALHAAAKPFYDILGHKFPPSPGHQLIPWSVESPSESGSNSCTQSVASTLTSSSIGGAVDSNRRYDVGGCEHLEAYGGLCGQSSQPIVGPSSDACSAVDVLEDPLITNGRIPEYLFESLPTWDFRRGIEEAQKFLPVSNKLVIDLESSAVARHQKARKDASANVRKANALNAKKNRQSEDLDLMEGWNIKQSAFCSDEPDWIEMFDDLLRQTEKKATDLRELMRNEASKNSQVIQTKGPSGPRTRGRKPTKKDVVDLRTILIHCAQAVAADDRRTANELLKQIRHHSKPNGDGTQRLAHCFADGLEARLAGTGSQLYHKLVAKRTTVSDMLKAYHLYLAACPFKRLSHFLSNQTILSMTKNASKVHIIDFGIYFGFQWPCLIRRLSKREGGPPVLRITGIDVPQPGFRPTERIEETGQRLAEYAKKFGVPFEYQGIASKWETIRVEDLKVGKDEVVIVNCLYRFRNLIDETVAVDSPRNRVLNTIRQVNPAIFIHGIVNGSYSVPFFITRFREALFHFSALFDMLETTVPRDDAQRALIEREMFGREALNVIACEGSDRVERPETYKQWQVRNLRAGFVQSPLNQEIMMKAKDKVKDIYHKDFVIDEDNGWLLQGWKGRIIYAISTWKPKNN